MNDLTGWTPRLLPERITLAGAHVRLEPLDPALHAKPLGALLGAPEMRAEYAHLPDLPPQGVAAAEAWIAQAAASGDPFYYAAFDQRTGEPGGRLALVRIEPRHGVIEIGSILYAPAIQRTPVTTEVMLLIGRYVFETLGYRRLEWKCNSVNERSRRAALRFGFRFEGVFRQHMVVKDQNRDTAWFSMLDSEWPARRLALEAWLSPDNFDETGEQKQSLSMFQAAADSAAS